MHAAVVQGPNYFDLALDDFCIILVGQLQQLDVGIRAVGGLDVKVYCPLCRLWTKTSSENSTSTSALR